MPARTRSANKQTKLEDVGAGHQSRATSKTANSKPATAKSGHKRRAKELPDESGSRDKKAAKQSHNGKNDHEKDDIVVINRALVLELWASCVAQLLHHTTPWQICLGAGSAISTVSAISKGSSIDKINKPRPGEAEERRQKRREKAEKEGLEELEVMSFNLCLDKDDGAMVDGKLKKAAEDTLRKKFGTEQYEKVKAVFEVALRSWTGKEEELDGKAFGMYEDLRPSTGWGRKGQLRLETVSEVIGGG